MADQYVNYLSYLDPNFWKGSMQPMIANSGLAFKSVAQQPNPMQQNPNLQALHGVNPTAPRFEFNRPSVQTGFYDPTNRLNLFLQTLQQARNNPALPAQQYVTPPVTPVQALGVNTPMPQQLGAGAPPPAAAPAAAPGLAGLTQQQLRSLMAPMSAFQNVKDYAKYAKNFNTNFNLKI